MTFLCLHLVLPLNADSTRTIARVEKEVVIRQYHIRWPPLVSLNCGFVTLVHMLLFDLNWQCY